MITLYVTPAQFNWFHELVLLPNRSEQVERVRGMIAGLALDRRVDGDAIAAMRLIGTPMCPEIRLIVE